MDGVTYELIKDPVVTPRGITYDREQILDQLKVSVGHIIEGDKHCFHDKITNMYSHQQNNSLNH